MMLFISKYAIFVCHTLSFTIWVICAWHYSHLGRRGQAPDWRKTKTGDILTTKQSPIHQRPPKGGDMFTIQHFPRHQMPFPRLPPDTKQEICWVQNSPLDTRGHPQIFFRHTTGDMLTTLQSLDISGQPPDKNSRYVDYTTTKCQPADCHQSQNTTVP